MNNFGSVYYTASNVNNQAKRTKFTTKDIYNSYQKAVGELSHRLDDCQTSLKKQFLEAIKGAVDVIGSYIANVKLQSMEIVAK
ncbi:hypothetical protein I2494_05390 [Budviciaceae bacterium BWR-B9]|uniref:DUF5405 domain-containing protein n=1 Tax=Limnobaculum allomyrinae TaxID=2791986 RepID=A0ABS1IN21_9GAMM|nr:MULTISPECIES: hypothetical protein [Limnobaculum]MBK5143152.1 hypothetical protein [Limnobaculum allomyrinae]MBV7691040.1 hypothetical protein [Limnobaculum sp. M2-1]